MATNLAIDPKLLETALAVSGEKTKKAAVTKALTEFIARREQKKARRVVRLPRVGHRVRLQERAISRLNLLVDTSVWSLALRRDETSSEPAVRFLADALTSGGSIFTTGLILQELLQGFQGPKARDAIIERFQPLPLLVPDREDHIQAAQLRAKCRRRGIQAGTVDALIAQLSLRHSLTLLTTDRDFAHIAVVEPLKVWPD